MYSRSHASDWINALEILRIRLGFARVVPNCDAFAADFYARLFELAPATRTLFPDDPSMRRLKLKQTLVMLMTSLNRPAELKPALASLAHRNSSCGLDEFILIGKTLIDTLATHLGNRFTPDDRSAWTALQARVAEVIRPDTEHSAAA